MPNPTPTPTPALTGLPEAIREALENSALASFHCGGWREGDEEPFRVVYDRAEAFKARLVAAITAALSQGVADAARCERRLRTLCEQLAGGTLLDVTFAATCEKLDSDYARSVTGGAGLIAAERQRQVEAEGWTPEHDDTHTGDEMLRAALCYAYQARNEFGKGAPYEWPWHDAWWKPSDDPIRNLVKAGALIAAEIDRLQRRTTLSTARTGEASHGD